jgi:HK97 gp10 family phage protein
MASVKFAFYGQAEFTEIIREMQNDFGEKDQKKILSKAMRVAMKPVLEKAKSLVHQDTGALRASLRIEARKPTAHDKKSIYVNPTDTVIGTVTTASGKQLAKGLRLYDYEASYKAKKNIYKKQSIRSDARGIANEFGTATMSAKPYLRPALETSSSQLLDSLAISLRDALTKYKAKPPKKGYKT